MIRWKSFKILNGVMISGAALLALAFLAIPAGADMYYYDMNTSGNYTQTGYTGVRITDVYNSTTHFGWDSSTGLAERDRSNVAPLPDLLRDFHFAGVDRHFYRDLADGTYTVTLYFRDTGYTHDTIYVYAEGVEKVSNLTVPIGSTPTIQTFSVAVSDGQLDLRFHNGSGGSDPNWIINAIDIVPAPPTLLLLGSGLLGLGLLGKSKLSRG